MIQADIGDVGEVHKTLSEFLKEKGEEVPKPDYWLYEFNDNRFFCNVWKHGKKVVGMAWGKVHPYYESNRLEMQGFFIRRGFRGNIKFTRGVLKECSGFLSTALGEGRLRRLKGGEFKWIH